MKNSFKGVGKFFESESASGILLGLSAVLAFLIANSDFSGMYSSFLDTKVFGLTIKYWINDGLMAIFFFFVGLEIKKELVLGHLNSPKNAALPLAAAIGGMVLPGIIYAVFNTSGAAAAGWGIPMATDIAFAVGVLSLFGKRIPASLKVFLLAVAIVDDLGAILVIAFVYTQEIRGVGLAAASLALGLAFLLRFAGVRSYFMYVLIGSVVWSGFLYSGVHATIAGVLLGLMTPTRFPKRKQSDETYSPLEDLVHRLHLWVGFGIMPVFALANAGVDLRGVNVSEIISSPILMGIVSGLFIGKPVGIILLSFLAVWFGLAALPSGLGWRHILGVGFLAGMGFTMSLFISGLALPVELQLYSKMGILVGSVLSGLAGSFVLKFCLPPQSRNV